jgi:hypothetical protein
MQTVRLRAEIYALGAVACWATVVATAFKLAQAHIAPIGGLVLILGGLVVQKRAR